MKGRYFDLFFAAALFGAFFLGMEVDVADLDFVLTKTERIVGAVGLLFIGCVGVAWSRKAGR